MFHLCTPFQDYVAHWRQLFGDITRSVLANALTCALPHRRPGGRARSLPTKHRKGAKYPELSRFFLRRAQWCPDIFLNWDLDSDRCIGLRRCALRKSAAVRDNRREQGRLRRRASSWLMRGCRHPKSASAPSCWHARSCGRRCDRARRRDVDDRLRHPDLRLRQRRITRGVIVTAGM